ncbi:hypothetical protein HYPSUDRAFT_59882 [Hypholoma sublateritium FD-334 SS-4]|uniref:Uncharacterized protein n=1 Tax=Hypholoma sublateritium (strain FD-334 SS-4) TaxID=945553 RepID=A0A0D2KG36_HYPSF|nr:hypothetical protein HYPSUDRAFT_59882 [Hypholoma sublateritium FD-334 SS-4]
MPSTATGANVFVPTQANTLQDSQDQDGPMQRQTMPLHWSRSPSPRVTRGISPSEDFYVDETPITPPPAADKRTREPATPTQPAPKRIRALKGAAALENVSTALASFSTTFATAIPGPELARVDPTPIRRTTAIQTLLNLEKDWLSPGDFVLLIDFFRTDITALDAYITLAKVSGTSEYCKTWLQSQLQKLQ